MPVEGRLGIEFSFKDLRFSVSGVMGELGTACPRFRSFRELKLGLFVAGENMGRERERLGFKGFTVFER